MFSKFFILLLYLIIAANSILGEPEDENQILRDSFNDCRIWLGKSLNSTISVPEFWYYMGKSKNDIDTISAYLDENQVADEKRDVMDLSLYGELFKMLCGTLDLTVKRCAELRKNEALKRTLDQVSSSLAELPDE